MRPKAWGLQLTHWLVVGPCDDSGGGAGPVAAMPPVSTKDQHRHQRWKLAIFAGNWHAVRTLKAA